MRLLWTYLILGVIFAFGFVCAAMFHARHDARAKRRAVRSPSSLTRAPAESSSHDVLAGSIGEGGS